MHPLHRNLFACQMRSVRDKPPLLRACSGPAILQVLSGQTSQPLSTETTVSHPIAKFLLDQMLLTLACASLMQLCAFSHVSEASTAAHCMHPKRAPTSALLSSSSGCCTGSFDVFSTTVSRYFLLSLLSSILCWCWCSCCCYDASINRCWVCYCVG